MFCALTEPDDDGAVLASLSVSPEWAEQVSDALFQEGATGVEERQPVAPGVQMTLLAGFPNRNVAWAALEALASPRTMTGAIVQAVVEVPADTWFDGWRAYAQPHRVGSRLVVHPPWLPLDAGAEDIVVFIDPGRAFGSGAHPSTQLVLAELEGRVQRGATVLDLGSGSGVLAVAAALLGATEVAAVDVDVQARRATAANAECNGVAAAVTVSERIPSGGFDLAVANIGANSLIELAPELVARAAVIVLAGFLAERTDEVLDAYSRHGATVLRRQERRGWEALTVRL